MKQLLTLLLFIIAANKLAAQSLPPLQPEQDACNALELCGNIFFTPYSYTGLGAINEQVMYVGGACFSESNSVWLKLTVATPGTIVFTITPVVTSNDYDFSVYNLTGHPCTDINGSTMIRSNGCDIFSAPGGLTGCSTSGSVAYSGPGPGVPFLSAINGVAGDVYYIMIDNFNTVGVAGFTIDFSASTATFVQAPTPQLANIIPACSYANSITLNTNVPVKCNSIASDGSDFFLTGGSGGTVASATGLSCSVVTGYTSTITLTFASTLAPGTYTLNAQTGTDGNTLLNLCGNALIPPSTLTFTVLPYSPPALVAPDTPACLVAQIPMTHPIKCNTVSENGSEFVITGPSAVTVVSAEPHNCIAGSTDTIDLVFDKSIFVPGTYTLSVINGSDGNGLVDSCGIAVSNSVSWVVKDRGYLDASASPNILCQPGYLSLNAAIGIPPPAPATIVCGTNNTKTYTPQQHYYIGDPGYPGSTTGSPFYGLYEDARTQFVIHAGELTSAGMTAGTIKTIALDVTQKNSTKPYKNFTIKMSCTADNDVTAAGGAFVSGLPVVFGPYPYTSDTGLNEFVLDEPYDWDGVSNIIVDICYDDDMSSATDLVKTTPVFANSTRQEYNYGTVGCAFIGGGSVAYNVRPNVVFSICPPLNIAGYHLAWTPGGFIGDSTAASTVAYLNSNTAWNVEIMDNNYCYRRDTVGAKISVRFPTLVPGQDTAICIGQVVPMHAGGGVSYFWYPSTGLSCTTCTDPIASPQVTTTYYVVIGDINSCTDTLSRTITVMPLPYVNAGPDTTIIYGDQIKLQAIAPNAGQILWSPVGSLDIPFMLDPMASPTINTTYTLRVIDLNGCANSDDVTVSVRSDIPVGVPTAFSPNGDGVNDIFRIADPTIQKLMEFRIFNRWGKEVFSTSDIKQGWDGTVDGVRQDIGVYNFLIRVAWPDGRMETYHGDLTLVR